MQDLKVAFKQLRQQPDAENILLDVLGINCQAADRGIKFCRIHQHLQEKINQGAAAPQSAWQKWTRKIKTVLSPTEEQELFSTLEEAYRHQCHAAEKKMCLGFEMVDSTANDAAMANDDRYAPNPKVKTTTGQAEKTKARVMENSSP